MAKETEIDRLNAAIVKSVLLAKPPERITVSEWADKYRRLPRSNAESGAWRTSRTPYLKEPMDAFTDPKVRRIVMVAASQVGKSEFELNCIGYVIHQDPGNILYIHPDIDDARKFSNLRVGPMIQDSPVLRTRVSKAKSRDSRNTILSKSFPGGMLLMCGSIVASDLASTPCRYVFGDEPLGGQRRQGGRPVEAGDGPTDHLPQLKGRGGLDADGAERQQDREGLL